MRIYRSRIHQLNIQKRNQCQWAIWISLMMVLFCGFLIDILRFPSAVKYIIDLMVLLLFVLCWMNLGNRRTFIPRGARGLLGWVLVFVVLEAFVYVANFQSPLYFLWGLRNNFRYYVFFLGCICFLTRENVDEYLELFDKFFFANCIVCIIQFFVFNKRGDFLGGFFGIQKGCNGYLNVFQVMIVIKSILYYLNNKETTKQCLIKVSLALAIAALAELKFFFIEFIVILLLCVYISKMSLRTVLIVAAGVLGVMAAIAMIALLFPWFADFFSLDAILNYSAVGGYSGAGQVNRLTAISMVSDRILKSTSSRIFGLGLGNCDTSNFDFLATPFHRQYVYIRYTWFSVSFLFLEMGFIGLLFYFGFFLMIGIRCFWRIRTRAADRLYYQIGFVAAISAMMITVYNSSMRTEAAYPLYFMLSIPFITQRNTEEIGGDRYG